MKFLLLAPIATLALSVAAVSYREFYLTPQRAGACFLINEATEDTKVTFELLTPYLRPLPLMIGNYFEMIEVPQWPNLDDFHNQTYIKGHHNRLVKVDEETGDFKFRLGSFPESWVTELFDQFYEFSASTPAVYCVYIPKTSVMPPFVVEVKVKDEPLVIELPLKWNFHILQAAVLLAVLGVTYLLGVPGLFSRVMFANVVFYSSLAFIEYLCLTLPSMTGTIQKFLVDYIYVVEATDGNPILEMLVLVLVGGYAKTWIPVVFVIGAYVSLWASRELLILSSHAIPQDFHLRNIVVNNNNYEVYYQSVVMLGGALQSLKRYVEVSDATWATSNVFYFIFALVAIQIGTVFVGTKAGWKLRSKDHELNRYRTPIYLLIFGYYVAYNLLVKKALKSLPIFDGPVVFTGAPDFGEVLLKFPEVIRNKFLLVGILELIGLAALYLIWRPYRSTISTRSNSKKITPSAKKLSQKKKE